MKDAHGNKLPSGYSINPGPLFGRLEWSQVAPGLRVLWLQYTRRRGWTDEPATIVGSTQKMVLIKPDGPLGSYTAAARYVPIHVLSKDDRNCYGI